jgi:hypothetical protein
MPIRTLLPFNWTTVIVMPEPMRITSPDFLLRTSIMTSSMKGERGTAENHDAALSVPPSQHSHVL